MKLLVEAPDLAGKRIKSASQPNCVSFLLLSLARLNVSGTIISRAGHDISHGPVDRRNRATSLQQRYWPGTTSLIGTDVYQADCSRISKYTPLHFCKATLTARHPNELKVVLQHC
ncbi:uncharacterized protein RCC_05468 [Ramularia collo-cygni]|uniref:Uncharacterized protein n=1 Tax=Ramularia collo-cygni TaxID=112498 RepID=A0A2D3V4J4_9PEZI|nr:uncharacterized protein RCC_05468 [Ramularia collo-cygni]CZT19617.1 uncharacterized protein RCC_05468 [Ramularia collo-cygni]